MIEEKTRDPEAILRVLRFVGFEPVSDGQGMRFDMREMPSGFYPPGFRFGFKTGEAIPVMEFSISEEGVEALAEHHYMSKDEVIAHLIGRDRTMTDYKEQRISVTNGQDVRFKGRLLGEFTTQNKAGTKSRWTELRLWETEGGAWVAESVGCSDNEREVDLTDVAVIEPSDPEKKGLAAMRNEQQLREAVMQHFGWTTAAKAFAREMGWEVYRRVA